VGDRRVDGSQETGEREPQGRQSHHGHEAVQLMKRQRSSRSRLSPARTPASPELLLRDDGAHALGAVQPACPSPRPVDNVDARAADRSPDLPLVLGELLGDAGAARDE
jgi:hypothetical protein